jgi:16S rRNA (cytosine967-C5)-methyltransferase
MNARDYALFELDRRRLPGWPANELRSTGSSSPADSRDYALAEQLTTGVIQNLLLLQHLIGRYSNRPLKKVDPVVQKILAIALYQLRFLTRVPARAAVDEAVEQTKRFGRRSAAGFVNAVLRNAIREPDVAFPDPSKDPESYAELALSHPGDVYRHFAAITNPDDALSLCRRDNVPPPTIVRLFPNVAATDLTADGVTLAAHDDPGLFVVSGAKQSTLAEWAERGLAQVQDPTAAKVVEFCDIRPGQTVLDRCAGLGTKTLQLHARVGPAGRILAVDPNVPRCQRLAKLLADRRIENVRIEPVGMMKEIRSPIPAAFDRVLVDAPCSNSGVLPRRPEARYHQDLATLASLRKLQLDILNDTAPRVVSGGLLIYSTCSIWRDENQSVVVSFLAGHPQFALLSEHPTLPSLSSSPAAYHDGGYVAVLRRGQT